MEADVRPSESLWETWDGLEITRRIWVELALAALKL